MRSGMAGVADFEKILWALMVLGEAGLVAVLIRSKNWRLYPAFFVYILMNLLQGAVVFLSYRLWGFSAGLSAQIAWGTQSVVVLTRALAIAEMCSHFLSRYRGIWALAWRILAGGAVLALGSSLLLAKNRWQLALLYTDRSLELAIAAAIVLLFLFARYYGIVADPTVRLIATGFCLYSCFCVLNDTILERWLKSYAAFWDVLDTLVFLASVAFWLGAFRRSQTERSSQPHLLTGEAYQLISPRVNLRLRELNEQLSQFWNVEARRP